MSQIERKRLNNSGQISDSSASNIGPWFALGAWAGGGVLEGINNIKSTDQILEENGKSYSTGAGFTYEKQNLIDVHDYMNNYNKQTGLSFLTNPFRGLTMLFGRNKAKKRAEQARNTIIRQNLYNFADAQSDYVDSEYDKLHQRTEDGILFAKHGKDIWTPVNTNGRTPNAKVSKGESIVDNLNNIDKASGVIVTKGKSGTDDQNAKLTKSSVVFGDLINPETGMRFKDEAAPFTQALNTINREFEMRPDNKLNVLRGSLGKISDKINQREINKIKQPIVEKLGELANKQKYTRTVQSAIKDGMIRAKFGWDDALGLGGMLTSLGRYIDTKQSRVAKPNTYVPNPYEQRVVRDLQNTGVNIQPILNQMYIADRVARYNNNQSGMLSGQKYLGNIAQSIGLSNNIGNLLYQDAQNRLSNRMKAAEIISNIGTQTAQRMQSAGQYDTGVYYAGQNAKRQQLQGAQADLLSQGQQWYNNRNTRNQYERMYRLYSDDLDIKRKNRKNNDIRR